MSEFPSHPPQTSEQKQTELPPPPLWLKQFTRWFRTGLGLFLLLSVLLSLVGCSARATGVPWHQATSIVPKPLVEQVITQNTSATGQEVDAIAKTMQAWQVEGREGKLVLFNFNTPELCGASGCLYVGIWMRKNQPLLQVFSAYLNPNLPRDQLLFERDDRQSDAALPCLKVMQEESARLRQSVLCMVENQYQVVDGRLLE